ncbi:hypothetical protein TREMEDRAFT_66256 [Tremella mesenterica DSM 1558]|uniref:uncharacterized protein n=1 Tax=Tremella mesenterica (strain ATCC 24925 / CBS 8224 / DSM 1558 / NBRC 9311 / NRRL Y-6157 / RJB 2259-6 / UBC 559-6) TaxID=578456 RepID=UPI00032D5205|nr:uncharacterized protein TREMEDRAFT_66256 [Tremella mesenterica DSM 1558]EIW65668.1 hypothetical protein TREMEDRAFT_66256 [Tremella mesenterica DSM 1558]
MPINQSRDSVLASSPRQCGSPPPDGSYVFTHLWEFKLFPPLAPLSPVHSLIDLDECDSTSYSNHNYNSNDDYNSNYSHGFNNVYLSQGDYNDRSQGEVPLGNGPFHDFHPHTNPKDDEGDSLISINSLIPDLNLSTSSFNSRSNSNSSSDVDLNLSISNSKSNANTSSKSKVDSYSNLNLFNSNSNAIIDSNLNLVHPNLNLVNPIDTTSTSTPTIQNNGNGQMSINHLTVNMNFHLAPPLESKLLPQLLPSTQPQLHSAPPQPVPAPQPQVESTPQVKSTPHHEEFTPQVGSAPPPPPPPPPAAAAPPSSDHSRNSLEQDDARVEDQAGRAGGSRGSGRGE